MNHLEEYPFEISKLSKEDGGGYLINYPDFNSCIADGETIEEAIENGKKALEAVIDALRSEDLPIPRPNVGTKVSGKFVLRVPKSLHGMLINRAKKENVSMNTLAIALLAEAMGKRSVSA